MATGTDVFSLLPRPMVARISEYCETKDVLSLSFSCLAFRNFLQGSMCRVNEKTYSLLWRIPIYFADQCHSVFVTCEVHLPVAKIRIGNQIYDVSVRSRSKNQPLTRDTIIWQTVRHYKGATMARYYICFRNNPSQEYFLHVVPRYFGVISFAKSELLKQFMTSSTQMMENTIKNCLRFQDQYPSVEDWPSRHPMDKMRLLMKLFVFCSESLSEESTPFRAFFTSSQVGRDSISLIKKQILNLFEQILDQKEPTFCVKQLLTREEMLLNGQQDPNSSRPATQHGNAPSTSNLALVKNFSWERSTKRRYNDQNDNFLHGEGLHFVARIPLAHKTTGLTCRAVITTDAPCKAMVFFFQRRQSSHVSSVEQMDGHVLSCHGISGSWTVDLELPREYEACFFYVVPGKTARISIQSLKVDLKVAAEDNNSDFCYWMRAVLGHLLSSPTLQHRLFQVALLRAAVLALLRQDGERFTTLKQDLEMEGLDTTPHGLQSLVLTCDAILRDWPKDSVSN